MSNGDWWAIIGRLCPEAGRLRACRKANPAELDDLLEDAVASQLAGRDGQLVGILRLLGILGAVPTTEVRDRL